MLIAGIDPGANGAICVLDSQDLAHVALLDLKKQYLCDVWNWLHQELLIHKDPKFNPIPPKNQIWVEDIKGIVYYIDVDNNVYNTEDVVANLENPRIIARWSKNELGVYSIPEFENMVV